MEWWEVILTGDKLLGAIVTVIGLLALGVRWFWKRVSRQVTEGVSSLQTDHKSIADRLERVEGDLVVMKGDISGFTGRMGQMERRVDTLATSDALADVSREVAGLAAHAEATRTQLRIIIEAAMRAEPGSKSS